MTVTPTSLSIRQAIAAQIKVWKLDAKLIWNRFQIFWYS